VFGQFKANGPTGLSLTHRRSINCVTIGTKAQPFRGVRKADPILSKIFLGQGLGAVENLSRAAPVLPQGSCCQQAKNRAEILNQIQRVAGAPVRIKLRTRM
jgi:hypothetical protein